MTIKLSNTVELEVTDAGEATVTFCDFDKEQVGHIFIDGSDLVQVTKCYKDGHNKTFLIDMIEPNVTIRPFPLQCDEFGNVL